MRTIPLNFPKSVLIETSNICHGKCLFCPYSEIKRGQKKEFLDYRLIEKMLNEISNYFVERVSLFNNNDPLLDKRIYDIVKLAHGILPNVELTLSTNGQHLTKSKIERLFNEGLSTLYISIPTLDKDAYQKIMGYELDKVLNIIDSIDNLKLLKMVRIAVPITNKLDIKRFDSYFGKRGIEVCSWFVEYKENWNIKDKINELVGFSKYIGPCDRPMDQAVILSNGNMVICCRDWFEENVIGNVKKYTIYELWHNKIMKYIQNKIATQTYDDIKCCRTCSLNINCYKRLVIKNEIPT